MKKSLTFIFYEQDETSVSWHDEKTRLHFEKILNKWYNSSCILVYVVEMVCFFSLYVETQAILHLAAVLKHELFTRKYSPFNATHFTLRS